MNVLFVSPHPDDIVLQNGGALQRHAGNCDTIHIIIVSECEHLERNAGIIEETNAMLLRIPYQSAARLELETRNLWTEANREKLRRVLEEYRDNERIDLVYCPWGGDVHQDHKAVFEEVARVFRYASVLQGFHPHSCFGFAADYYIPMTPENVVNKIELIALFATQSGLKYCGIEYNINVMRFAGAEINQEYAERYKVWRLVQ